MCFDRNAFLAAVEAGTKATLLACGLDPSGVGTIVGEVLGRLAFIRPTPDMAARGHCTANIRRKADVSTPRHSSILSDGVVAVPVDREIRRRVFCSRAGYCYRFFAAIEGNNPTYRRENGTVETAAAERTLAAVQCFDGVRLPPIRQLVLPHAYCLPKSK